MKTEGNTLVAGEVISSLKKMVTDDKMRSTVIDLLKTEPVSKYINYLVYQQIGGGRLSDEDFQNLRDLIFVLQTVYNYFKEECPVTDYDYDRLYELLEDRNEDMVTTPIVGTPESRVSYHKYRSLRGTLKKVYALSDTEDVANKSRRTLDDWIRECETIYEEKSGQKRSLKTEDVYIFPKWDGVSVIFEFDKKNRLTSALTRGNTETNEAQVITHLFSCMVDKIRDPEKTGTPYGIKTEVMVTEKDKDAYNKKYNTDYHSTRSIASAITREDHPNGRENLLEIVKLRTSTLDENGEETFQELSPEVFERPYLVCNLSDRETIRKWGEKHKSIKGLNTDGVVIYFINEEIRKVLGRKDHKNQYEVAYKFNEAVGYTKVKGIKFGVTSFGRLFPTAELEPIVLKGNTITDVSLGSISRMMQLQLAKKDTVKILYEIIPYLVMDGDDPKCKRSGNLPILPPEKCPECGGELDSNIDGVGFYCTNPDCSCRIRRRVLRYMDIMGIKNVGEETIRKLQDARLIRGIDSIYELKDEDLATISGIGTLFGPRLRRSLAATKVVSASTFLTAIGIEGIGVATFDKVLTEFTIDDLFILAEDKKVSALLPIPGIQEKTAMKILQGMKENESLVKKFLKKEWVELTYPTKGEEFAFIAVFHKIRSRRLELYAKKLYHGKVEDNLTKRTTFLIVPDGFNEETGTATKAKSYGIPIVEISQAPNWMENCWKKYEKERKDMG